MKSNKAYKFRIYPNAEQQKLIDKTIGCTRFIYNKMLADKIEYYNINKEKLNNTPAQYKKEFEWLKEVDSLALANAQMNLQTAYNNFFRNKSVGFPKFKSKHKSNKSYTTNNQKGTVALIANNKKIKLPKLGLVEIKCHRTIKKSELIKSCTISLTPSGKYYISILVEYEQEIEKVKPVAESLAFYRVRKDSISSSKVKLIKYNYFIYKDFHGNNLLKAVINTGLFLVHQLLVKPIFTKSIKSGITSNSQFFVKLKNFLIFIISSKGVKRPTLRF